MSAVISGAEPIAVEAGAEVLRNGGNAIDAAVTCAFVQGIVNPQMCGIGGYALALIQRPNEAPVLIDGPALAGSLVKADMWVDHYIRLSPDGWGYFLKDKVNDKGYTSICTPGTVKTLHTILTRYGTRSWESVIAPAIETAERGFMVDSHLANRWKGRVKYPEQVSMLEYVTSNREASRIYLKDGMPYDEGEMLKNPDYATTLRHLAKHGADDFYHGALAKTISTDLAANGAYVTAADLAEYQVSDEQVIRGTYRGYDIVTSQAPHGGPTVVEILNILEGFNINALGHNSAEYIYLVAMAMKAAFTDRNAHLGDPRAGNVPVAWMTSKARATEWQAHIRAGKPIRVSDTPTTPPDTTHISVVDHNGMCVALTHSLGMSSGVITPGLGFMYNNSMVNFHPFPGHRNSIAPRVGRTTGMAPTIISKDGKPILVVGAPGASRIITAVLQTIINFLDFGMSVSDAIAAPRIDCQGDNIVCQMRIPEYICAEVRKQHPISRLPFSYGAMALVHAVSLRDGIIQGGADPGCSGVALHV
ncbi:MAG: gamma-glutamyltransferase [Roseiflexaceae bacterium]|jgi:gamma-glutamyltranspeptidase / glutathione hydrolase|nr:gamma-glutamyltransferase [Chloroflexaceae bacterium]